MDNLRFSIITPSFNHGKYIEKSITSVVNQNYPNFEHIIMDGGSSDETVSILKKYPHLKWFSEKDRGQSHAINKGLKIADGDIIAWLNSDDYYDKRTFQIVADYFSEHQDAMCLCGCLTYISEDDKDLFKVSGDNINFESLIRNPDLIRQPATFWRRELLDAVGFIDESLHLVMDLDFFLRISKRYKIHFVNENLAFFRYYETNKTLSSLKKQALEIMRIVHRYRFPAPFSFYKFALGRYLDGLSDNNIAKKILSPLRKNRG